MISGYKPIVGRRVYDLILGYGVIASVEPDFAVVVDYGGARQQRYSAGGYVGKVRRLFWDNPVVVEPIPGDRAWGMFAETSRNIYTMLSNLTNEN